MIPTKFKIKLNNCSENKIYAIELLNEGLGENFYTIESISPYVSNHPDRFLISAHADTKLVGVMLVRIIHPKHKDPLLDKLKSNGIGMPARPVAVLQAEVVHKEFRGQGIGKELFRQALNELIKRKVKSSMGTAWGTIDNPIHKIFLGENFINQGSLEDYWYHDSLAKEYNCPKCCNPCYCNAILYIKTML